MSGHIPYGWELADLRSVVGPDGLMTDGDWIESKDQDPAGDVRLIQLADVGAGRFLDKSSRFLMHGKAGELGCTFLHAGDVLISRLGDPLGKTCLFPNLGQPCITAVDVHIVRPGHPAIDRDWLMHTLNSAPVRRVIESQSSGTTRKRITGKKLKDLKLPVPPAAEQTRVASKIDELFSRIDEGEQALNRVAKLVERYRQSVLKAAVTGELTRDWRAARQRAGEPAESGAALLARILKARRAAWEQAELARLTAKGKPPTDDRWKHKYREPTPPDTTDLPELPEGWGWASLEQLVRAFGNGLSRKPADEPPGVPILRISAVRPMLVDASDVRYYCTANGESIDGFTVQDGDILFTRYNGSKALVGACGVFRGGGEVLHPDKLMRARVVDAAMVDPDFAAIACNAGASFSHISSCVKTSAGQHGIAGSDVKRTPVPLPPYTEQSRIVGIVAALGERCSIALRDAGAEAHRAGVLRQSILKAAFSGQLVPQDPDDEPASKLLERIAAERAAAPAKPRRGRRARPAQS